MRHARRLCPGDVEGGAKSPLAAADFLDAAFAEIR
jgi:hypothetical protein